ncbi:MAG TPA: NAD(P)H-dependent oxidoreductase subunit E [Planctomycetota bacterium]|nr:NAD(P)H-dependent oxidoreductase subunit E [Planctomycetota bacterium]
MTAGIPTAGIPMPKKAAAPPAAPDPRRHFGAETIARFESWKRQYPDERAALIPILHAAQDEKGWLSRETLEAVAAYLKLPFIRVYEVASFYPMFHLRAVGRHVAWVCRNISCDLRGASAIVETFRRKCGIGPDETTPDGKLTLKLAECLGGCASAPVVDLDGVYRENLDVAQVEKLIAELK